MIKIVGNDITRGGEKIGWIEGNDIYDHNGHKLGYASGNNIYNHGGQKLGYLEGDHLKGEDGSTNIHLEENRRVVTGGSHSDLTRGAIRILLGE